MKKSLSYSSMTLLAKCEQKYWHHKVNETLPDEDIEDSTESLDVGKAFHKVLEDSKHEYDGDESLLKARVKASCEENNCTYAAFQVLAMAMKYYEVVSKYRLTAVMCEVAIQNTEFEGYIDVIFKDKWANWYITDIKTAKKFDESKLKQLHKDMQLNLYAYFAKQIGNYLGLDYSKFRGVIYRVVTKPKLKKSNRENDTEYLARLVNHCQVVDLFVTASKLSWNEQYGLFEDYRERAKELFAGRAPLRNYANCFDYFRPCKWFSQCHGNNITGRDVVKLADAKFYLNINSADKARSKL